MRKLVGVYNIFVMNFHSIHEITHALIDKDPLKFSSNTGDFYDAMITSISLEGKNFWKVGGNLSALNGGFINLKFENSFF